MQQEQHAAVVRYLGVHFPGRFVEQQTDFDRDARSFKVHLEQGTLLLKVAAEVLGDVGADALPDHLDRLEVGETLQRSPGQTVLVTTNGLSLSLRV